VLFEARERRIKPGRDDKVLTAWNGLMLRSFAEAARILQREDYREVAIRNAEFLLTQMYRDGRLLRTHRAGESKLNAYLEDYAYLADGLLALYEATFDPRWFVEARSIVETMIEQFWDDEGGAFYFTGRDHEELISRTKDVYDNATPSGNSVAVSVLLRMALFTEEGRYRQLAEKTLRLLLGVVQRAPSAFGHLLCAFDLALASPFEIAIIGNADEPETTALVNIVFGRYLPNRIVASASTVDDEARNVVRLLEGRVQVDGKPTAYVCFNHRCEAPTTDPAALDGQL
jgi:uncharacterized protein YyaL (SSP411 family)